MKYTYPHHLILELESKQVINTPNYWVSRYSTTFTQEGYFNTTLGLLNLNPLTIESTILKRSTALLGGNITTILLKPEVSSSKIKDSRVRFIKDQSRTSSFLATSLVFAFFDVNFIKKERLYTKLKYSRSPAYDIVSGGAAALLSAFIGFLISEKFGIELVDSGDFYIVFMYAVALVFSCRPLLRSFSCESLTWGVFSTNYIACYWRWIFTRIIFVIWRYLGRFFI